MSTSKFKSPMMVGANATSLLVIWFISSFLLFGTTGAFVSPLVPRSSKSCVSLGLFKLFEDSGPLGKGITVGKVQVALSCPNRSSGSLFGQLEKISRGSSSSSPSGLARLANDVCLTLLRKSDDWMGACSTSKWFGGSDGGKAESLFNDWANREASKFEKEYVPGADADATGGGPTLAVVSVVVEIQGDTTTFDGAGYSLSGTREVLSSVASNVQVASGGCLNAVEVFWTPSDRSEVLTKQDVILDFPEIIDL